MLDKRKLDAVLQFINRYTDENGFPPTVRDICAELQIKSTATAYDYVNRLKEMGYLQKKSRLFGKLQYGARPLDRYCHGWCAHSCRREL